MGYRLAFVSVVVSALLLGGVPIRGAFGQPAGAGSSISDIRVTPQNGSLQIVLRADGPLAAQTTQPDSQTILVRLPGALLPSSFPNFQSVSDPIVVSLTAQQTAIAPPSALLSITIRAPAGVTTTTSDANRTLTLTIAPPAGSARGTATYTTPAPVQSAVSGGAASMSPRGQPLQSTVVAQPPLAQPVAPAPRSATSARETVAISLVNVSASSAVAALRPLFPRANFRVESDANAIVVNAPARDLAPIRAVLAGIDVQGATRRSADAVILRYLKPRETVPLLRAVFPRSSFSVSQSGALVIVGSANELPAIRQFIASLDTVPATPAATTSSDVLRLSRASAESVAAALSPAFKRVRFTPSGQILVVSGPIADIERVRTLVAAADVGPALAQTPQIYKIRAVNAVDVAAALRKAYPSTQIVEDAQTNAIVVKATDAVQAQVASAIATLDVAAGPGSGGVATAVVQLQNAVPGQAGTSGSSSASDMATALASILAPQYPDLRVTVPANTTMIAITGSLSTIAAARELLSRIDVAPTQLILDTAIYEIDETAARNVGLQMPNPVILESFTEATPVPNAFGVAPPLGGLGKFGRTALSFQAQLNLLISNGNGRVLANPRITTISGRIATIRAGDNIPYVQTINNGLVGTVSQTVLTFQTGVTLDITPIANPDGRVSVTLHPIVNTRTGTTDQGVPQIASREAQTTVNLRDNETVVIGGLIQETTTDTRSKIPLVGDIPVVGGLFRNKNLNVIRNELIIVVTPHVVPAGSSPAIFQSPPVLPTSRLAPYRTPGAR